MKYIKKPVAVEAWQAFDFGLDDKMPYWVTEAFMSRKIGETRKDRGDYYINTLEGKMYFWNGDYVIRGVHNELYVVKKDIFEETYTEVAE